MKRLHLNFSAITFYIIVVLSIAVFLFDIPLLWAGLCFLAYLLGSAVFRYKMLIAWLGNYQQLKGNAAQAEKFYDKSFMAGCRNIQFLYQYGYFCLQQNNPQKALEILDEIPLDVQSTLSKQIEMTRAHCCWLLGDNEKALALMEKIEEVYPYASPTMLTTMGYLYLLENDTGKALHYTQKALAEDNQHAPAYDNLGQIYYCLEDYDQALDNLLKANQLYDQMAETNYYLGMVYEKKGNDSEAKRFFDAASQCPRTPFTTVPEELIREKYRQYH